MTYLTVEQLRCLGLFIIARNRITPLTVLKLTKTEKTEICHEIAYYPRLREDTSLPTEFTEV